MFAGRAMMIDDFPLLAHRVISLLRSNYDALGAKQTSTRDAISLDSASFATISSGKTGT
jgi:hypothetical protein